MSRKKVIIVAGVVAAVLLVALLIAFRGRLGANRGFYGRELFSDTSAVDATPEGQSCAVAAEAYYARTNRDTGPDHRYASHYNTETRQCFIETVDVGPDLTAKFVLDVDTSRTYARAYLPNSKATSFSCWTGKGMCLTEKDFDEYVNSIMKK